MKERRTFATESHGSILSIISCYIVSIKRWAVYLIVLEKPDHRPKFYIGTGTDADRGVSGRLTEYDIKKRLPRFVQNTINRGHSIVYKGLICWALLPTGSKKFGKTTAQS